MDEWNQERAQNRSIDIMRHIALDTIEFKDNYGLFDQYAEKHNLTLNEIVYYLNAYEYGGDAGLQAIHSPDVIPFPIANQAIETIIHMLDSHFKECVRYQVFHEETAIVIYQINQYMDGQEYLFEICQFRLTLETGQWHLYWRRQFDAWWPYPPPQKRPPYTFEARMQQVLDDVNGCFWG